MKIQANPINVGKNLFVELRPGDCINVIPEKDALAELAIEDFLQVLMNKRGTITVLCFENGKIAKKLKFTPQNHKKGDQY